MHRVRLKSDHDEYWIGFKTDEEAKRFMDDIAKTGLFEVSFSGPER